MINRVIYKSKIILQIFIIFIGLVVAPTMIITVAEHEEIKQSNIKTLVFSKNFSTPIIVENEEYIKINLYEENSFITKPGNPKLPVFTKTFEFSWGTEIIDIKLMTSNVKRKNIENRIEPIPTIKSINDNSPINKEINQKIYNSQKPYPADWFNYRVGVGLNDNGERVLYLSIHTYPVRYLPFENVIEHIDNLKIYITKKEPEISEKYADIKYDLVIITPSQFSSSLTPLINHKNNHGINATIKSIESIYTEFEGRDKPEKIKYFIKYAIEEWHTKYILLIGDIKKLPIRTTDAYPWTGFHGNGILCDLYYADVYDENFDFCSWDINKNDIFGETENNEHMIESNENIDDVDLYPDIYIGRIPCATEDELTTVVNKIITYEEITYDQTWFKKIILVGGDTFPLAKFSPPFVYEGEITNIKVGQQLPEFEQVKLWASKHNLNAVSFNRAIKEGAGFVSYAGHGFEHGWGTYRLNAIRGKMFPFQPMYFTPFIKYIKNEHKLPIFFFDACLTAKLDFNITDLKAYFNVVASLFNMLPGARYIPSDYFPSFAWCLLKEENGGSIATIGATRPAYTNVDKDGVYAGAGYLDVHFFKSYEEGITVGEMLTQAQNNYINYVGKDFFTIEEFILLGDPSLKVGGYP